MITQNGLLPEQTHHDPETGEVAAPLSSRATQNVPPRRYWDRLEGLVIRGADEQHQSQYELAFLAAQKEIQAVLATDKDATITKERSYSYTSLGQLMSHVRPILNKHGFTFKQGCGRIHRLGVDAGHQVYLPLYLKLTYVGTGESETYINEMPLLKLDPQALKSAKTYGKRQLIEDTFGIASADDDAIAAMATRSMSKDDEEGIVAAISEKIKACASVEELQKWGEKNKQGISGLSDEKYNKIRTAYGDRLKELQEASQEPAKAKGK